MDDDNVVNLVNRVLLSDVLPDVQVQVYNSPIEAIDFLRANAENANALPQLILLDLNMPEMDGWEFCTAFEKIFLAKKKYQVVPDIKFLSTSSHSEDQAKSLSFSSVSEYLVKPLMPDFIERKFK